MGVTVSYSILYTVIYCLVCKCFVLPFDDPPLSALQSFSSLEFHPLKSFSPLDPPVQARNSCAAAGSLLMRTSPAAAAAAAATSSTELSLTLAGVGFFWA